VSEGLTFASYPAFKADRARLAEIDRDVAAKEVAELFDDLADRVQTRGIYSTAGFTAAADLMMWWVGRSMEDIQQLLVSFKHTRLGGALDQTESFLGLVRDAEFTQDHLPSFLTKPPKRYLCVYPFVRTPEWYLLEPDERSKLLKEHGLAAREFADVQANTTSAFGLGDFEWILAFEADSPDRIVDLIRALRATEARRYTKVEIPFVTGIRKDVADIVADLP
jgi:peroxiredoxin